MGERCRPILLIVEDNGDLRQYIRGHLQEQYRVLESENGTKGWETALATIPDLIISDWMMPDMGREVPATGDESGGGIPGRFRIQCRTV
jgi:CheY-like chemotaxis protein